MKANRYSSIQNIERNYKLKLEISPQITLVEV